MAPFLFVLSRFRAKQDPLKHEDDGLLFGFCNHSQLDQFKSKRLAG